MMPLQPTEDQFKEAVEHTSRELDADLISYCGNLFPPSCRRFIDTVRRREQKKRNVVLILHTSGGSADSAYRIAHCLQREYSTPGEDGERGEFSVYVHDYCKSAGTILSLGADKLIMSQQAELGPIDVQLRKEEEVGDWTSGLNALEAFATLKAEALSMFEDTFNRLRFHELGFSTKVASDVATELATSLLQPIYGQIDPMRLGEIQRSVRISIEYGERLSTRNVRGGTVDKLVVGYPSHGFIIDRLEAEQELFVRVEKPSDELEIAGQYVLIEALKAGAISDISSKPLLKYLNVENEVGTEKTTTSTDEGPSRSAATKSATRAKPKGKSTGRKARGKTSRASANGAAAS